MTVVQGRNRNPRIGAMGLPNTMFQRAGSASHQKKMTIRGPSMASRARMQHTGLVPPPVVTWGEGYRADATDIRAARTMAVHEEQWTATVFDSRAGRASEARVVRRLARWRNARAAGRDGVARQEPPRHEPVVGECRRDKIAAAP